jgi:hypothetical protein
VLDVLTPLEAAAAAGDAPVPAKVQAAVEARVRMKKVSAAGLEKWGGERGRVGCVASVTPLCALSLTSLPSPPPTRSQPPRAQAFGYAKEDEELVLKPMSETAHEPIGSMGDDTPIAAFSAKPQLLYRYFKQRFAEVTNPPIDPLLERSVMSLNITFGRKGMLLQEDQGASYLLRFPSPVVTEQQLSWCVQRRRFELGGSSVGRKQRAV